MVRRSIAALALALVATACSGSQGPSSPAPATAGPAVDGRTNVVPVGDRTLTTDNVPHVP